MRTYTIISDINAEIEANSEEEAIGIYLANIENTPQCSITTTFTESLSAIKH